MLRLGFGQTLGGDLEATFRALDNQSYGTTSYQQARELEIRYSRPWQQFLVGAELNSGRDSFGESFGRLSGFVRF
jgi:hypothetical protein